MKIRRSQLPSAAKARSMKYQPTFQVISVLSRASPFLVIHEMLQGNLASRPSPPRRPRRPGV
eukprot:5055045-Prymnesium_polylepis.1